MQSDSSRNDISSDHDKIPMGPSENNGHHNNCIKTHEAKWPLEFVGDIYDCAGEGQPQR
jgi:hypothetical protein